MMRYAMKECAACNQILPANEMHKHVSTVKNERSTYSITKTGDRRKTAVSRGREQTKVMWFCDKCNVSEIKYQNLQFYAFWGLLAIVLIYGTFFKSR